MGKRVIKTESVTITLCGSRYVVEYGEGMSLRILSQASFDWNMKHVFKLKSAEIKTIHERLAYAPVVLEIAA